MGELAIVTGWSENAVRNALDSRFRLTRPGSNVVALGPHCFPWSRWLLASRAREAFCMPGPRQVRAELRAIGSMWAATSEGDRVLSSSKRWHCRTPAEC